MATEDGLPGSRLRPAVRSCSSGAITRHSRGRQGGWVRRPPPDIPGPLRGDSGHPQGQRECCHGGGGEPSARVTWDCKFHSHPSLVVTSRGPCSATHGTCRPMPGAFVLPAPVPSPAPPARPCPPGPTPSGGNQEGQTVPAWCRPRGRETQGLRGAPPSLPLLSDPKVDMGTQQGSRAGSQAGAREVMLAPRRPQGGQGSAVPQRPGPAWWSLQTRGSWPHP